MRARDQHRLRRLFNEDGQFTLQGLELMKRLLTVGLLVLVLIVSAFGLYASASGDINGTDVASLIKNLNDENSIIRADVASTLGQINDIRAVEPLIKALEDNDSKVRYQAAESLGELNDTRAIDPLIQALKDNDSIVRFQAASSLGLIKNGKAVSPSIRDFFNDSNSNVSEKFLQGLLENNRYIS